MGLPCAFISQSNNYILSLTNNQVPYLAFEIMGENPDAIRLTSEEPNSIEVFTDMTIKHGSSFDCFYHRTA